jgi:hypothetical protein
MKLHDPYRRPNHSLIGLGALPNLALHLLHGLLRSAVAKLALALP